MTKVSFKYMIQKVRGKINYMAFVKQQTILELFLRQIQNSYADFVKQGTIVPVQSYGQIHSIYEKLVGGCL